MELDLFMLSVGITEPPDVNKIQKQQVKNTRSW